MCFYLDFEHVTPPTFEMILLHLMKHYQSELFLKLQESATLGNGCLWWLHLLKSCLVLLLATFWRHSGYDSFWLWLSIHTRQQPSCQREIGMKDKSSHWGLSEFFSAPTPVKRSYSTRKDEEGWGTDLSLYIYKEKYMYTCISTCMYVYIHTYFLNKVLCLSLFEVFSQPLRGRPLKEKSLRQFQKHSEILFFFSLSSCDISILWLYKRNLF